VRLDLPPDLEAAMLEELRLLFEAGDGNALIRAIRFTFNQERPAPEWVAAAFFRATNRWYAMQVKSLDEALGVAWPKGKSIAAAKKRRALRFAVYNEIRQTLSMKPETTIDDELFEEIGGRLGIGKTLVKNFYRSARDLVEQPTIADVLLEPFAAPKRPTRQRRKK
jgi:hypothetical protein